MTFMFLNSGGTVSLGTCTKSLLVCLSYCPSFLIFWKKNKVFHNPLSVQKPSCIRYKPSVFNEWFAIKCFILLRSRSPHHCHMKVLFYYVLGEFTAPRNLVLLDWGFGFLRRQPGELRFKRDVLCMCASACQSATGPDCHGDCRLPVE